MKWAGISPVSVQWCPLTGRLWWNYRVCYKLMRIYYWMYRSQGKDKHENSKVNANLPPDFFFDAFLCFWKRWHCCHIWPAKGFCHLLQGHISKELLNMCEKYIQDTVADLQRPDKILVKLIYSHHLYLQCTVSFSRNTQLSVWLLMSHSPVSLPQQIKIWIKNDTLDDLVLTSQNDFTLSLTCVSEAFLC